LYLWIDMMVAYMSKRLLVLCGKRLSKLFQIYVWEWREIWKRRCVQQDASTAGGRWRRQHRIGLDGEEWSMAYVSPVVRQVLSQVWKNSRLPTNFDSSVTSLMHPVIVFVLYLTSA